MRNKILALLLIISVAFNIYLLTSFNTIKTTIESKSIEVNNLTASIKEKEHQLSDINTQFNTIQTQLNELKEQKDLLEIARDSSKDELIEVLKDEEGISPLAGTTSKHGYRYADNYIEDGLTLEDSRADIERYFDEGWITEEEYQEMMQFREDVEAGKIPTIEELGAYDATQDNGSSSVPAGGTSSSSSPPGTPGYDPATYIPEGKTYKETGIYCY